MCGIVGLIHDVKDGKTGLISERERERELILSLWVRKRARGPGPLGISDCDCVHGFSLSDVLHHC